jgi:hypothetical protein
MMSFKRLPIGALIVCAGIIWSQPACDGFPEDEPYVDKCKVALGHVSLPDNWAIGSLKGNGIRTGCTNDDYNKDFQFSLSKPIWMLQQANVNGPTFTGSVGDDFKVTDGTITGICISFTTEEKTPSGEIHRTFNGLFDNYAVSFSGDFSGVGPDHCDVSGTFRAVVE